MPSWPRGDHSAPDTRPASNAGMKPRSLPWGDKLEAGMPADPTSRAPVGAALLTVGGIGAAFAAASCCGLPFLLASTGIGFAWLTGLATFSAPYRPLLLVGAAICLAGGAPVARAEGRAGLRHPPASREKRDHRRLGIRCRAVLPGICLCLMSFSNRQSPAPPAGTRSARRCRRMPASISMNAPAAAPS